MTTNRINGAMTRAKVIGMLGVALGLSTFAGREHAQSAKPATMAGQTLAHGDSGVTWRAVLVPPDSAKAKPNVPTTGEAVRGTATLTPTKEKQSRAEVHVMGAKPGSTHPWHVHRGTCGKDQGIVGPANAYTPLHIGADGAGTVVQTLPYPTPTSGTYMVNVHKAPTDLKTIVACGSLQRQ